MNCSESLYWLQLRLDGEPVPNLGGLRDHLSSCADCRELHAAAGRLTEGLRLQPVFAPPPGLSAAIVQAVVAERRTQFRNRRLTFSALAAAACLLIAVYLGWPRQGGPNDIAHVLPTPHQSMPTMPQPELNAGPSVRQGIYDMGNAYVSLTYRYADETIGQGKVLLPEKMPSANLTALPEVTSTPTVPEGAAPGVSAPAQVVAKKFESAANSMSFLWRTKPSAPEKQ